MHVLILGARAPACLEWARVFRAAGWRVTAGDSLLWPVTRFSNAIHDYLRLPEPRPDPAGWIDALAREVEARGIDLVLPTCEESFYLSHGRERIPARVVVPPFPLMHELHHKGRFAEMVKDWAVEAPETHVLASRDDLDSFIQTSFPPRWESSPAGLRNPGAQALPLPTSPASGGGVRPLPAGGEGRDGKNRAEEQTHGVSLEPGDQPLDSPLGGNEEQGWVFKPAYSRFANRTLLRPSAEQLRAITPTPDQPWVAQRFAAGREHCSYSLLVEGRLTAHACYHPRYRVGRGSGIWFEPTDPAPIRAFLERFGAETGYTGQVAFDFIELADGSCRVIECNPRATSGVHFFDDQPEQLVAALLGADGVLTPTPEPRQVALAMLLFATHKHGFDRRFWRDWRAARDVVARPGDRGPLPAQIPGLLEIVGRALSRRCGLLAAATADSEWNGQSLDTPPCA
jgi:hypothetical protein